MFCCIWVVRGISTIIWGFKTNILVLVLSISHHGLSQGSAFLLLLLFIAVESTISYCVTGCLQLTGEPYNDPGWLGMYCAVWSCKGGSIHQIHTLLILHCAKGSFKWSCHDYIIFWYFLGSVTCIVAMQVFPHVDLVELPAFQMSYVRCEICPY